jgi:RNA polymerase sigma factor (sigma-70 family)
MPTLQAETILRHIHNLIESTSTSGPTDTQLLHRYVTQRDESAFAALLRRHGRLVWNVCRRFLHHEQDAEDVFQATFLVLARRAECIHKAEAIASWLYGVAYKIAMKAKRRARKRQDDECQSPPRVQSQATNDLALRELQVVLDEELQRLPAKYRDPFVLCCLEGRTRTDACAELGCGEGTISSRIARARRLLHLSDWLLEPRRHN